MLIYLTFTLFMLTISFFLAYYFLGMLWGYLIVSILGVWLFLISIHIKRYSYYQSILSEIYSSSNEGISNESIQFFVKPITGFIRPFHLFKGQLFILYSNEDVEGLRHALLKRYVRKKKDNVLDFYRAYIQYMDSQFEQAYRSFQNIISCEPLREAYFYSALCQLYLDNKDRAESLFTELLGRDSNYYLAYFYLGMLIYNKNKKQALPFFYKFLEFEAINSHEGLFESARIFINEIGEN